MILLPTYVSNLRPAGQMLPAKAQKLKKFLIALEKKNPCCSVFNLIIFLLCYYILFLWQFLLGGGGVWYVLQWLSYSYNIHLNGCLKEVLRVAFKTSLNFTKQKYVFSTVSQLLFFFYSSSLLSLLPSLTSCSHSQLIYESFARYLVEHKGFDPELLSLTPATWDFWWDCLL